MATVQIFWLLFSCVIVCSVIGHDDHHIDDVIRLHLSKNFNDEHRPFFVVDVEAAIKRVHLWKQCLPRVNSYYCMKTNPNPFLLELYAAYDYGFDCATKVTTSSGV